MSEVDREVQDGVDATVGSSAAAATIIDQTFGQVSQSKVAQPEWNDPEASAGVGSPLSRNLASDDDRPLLVPGLPAGDDSFFYAQVQQPKKKQEAQPSPSNGNHDIKSALESSSKSPLVSPKADLASGNSQTRGQVLSTEGYQMTSDEELPDQLSHLARGLKRARRRKTTFAVRKQPSRKHSQKGPAKAAFGGSFRGKAHASGEHDMLAGLDDGRAPVRPRVKKTKTSVNFDKKKTFTSATNQSFAEIKEHERDEESQADGRSCDLSEISAARRQAAVAAGVDDYGTGSGMPTFHARATAGADLEMIAVRELAEGEADLKEPSRKRSSTLKKRSLTMLDTRGAADAASRGKDGRNSMTGLPTNEHSPRLMHGFTLGSKGGARRSHKDSAESYISTKRAKYEAQDMRITQEAPSR